VIPWNRDVIPWNHDVILWNHDVILWNHDVILVFAARSLWLSRPLVMVVSLGLPVSHWRQGG